MKPIRARMVLLAAAAAPVFAVLLSGVFITILRASINEQMAAIETTLRDDHDHLIRGEAKTAVSVPGRLATLRDTGAPSRKDTFDLARSLLRDLRYDGDKYCWAGTPEGDNMVLPGGASTWTNRLALKDVNGFERARAIIEKAMVAACSARLAEQAEQLQSRCSFFGLAAMTQEANRLPAGLSPA